MPELLGEFEKLRVPLQLAARLKRIAPCLNRSPQRLVVPPHSACAGRARACRLASWARAQTTSRRATTCASTSRCAPLYYPFYHIRSTCIKWFIRSCLHMLLCSAPMCLCHVSLPSNHPVCPPPSPSPGPQFDQAAFHFKFLPFTLPYPVPFRLLGDERKVRRRRLCLAACFCACNSPCVPTAQLQPHATAPCQRCECAQAPRF